MGPMRKFFQTSAFFLLSLPSGVFAITPQDYYQAGLNLYSQKQYAQAIAYFKTAVQLDPGYWQAYQQLGTSYYLLNQIPRALWAFGKSLSLHPDNPVLERFADSIRAAHPEATPVSGPVTSATRPPLELAPSGQPEVLSWPRVLRFSFLPQPDKNSGVFWLEVYAGYNHSSMGDLADVLQNWNLFAQVNGYTSASSSINVNGVVAGIEPGLSLDKENALSLSLDGVLCGNFQAMASGGSDGNILENIDPSLLALCLNYRHYFYQKQNRFSVGIGAGYGLAVVHYVGPVFPSGNAINTDLLGGSFVGSIQAGEELMLYQNFSVEFDLKGRYAVIPRVGNGSDSLATLPIGAVFLVDNGSLGSSGSNYTHLDFTGPDVKISFNFYF
jgi:tetratricopeptide (TPR) repeat protein